MHEQSPRQANGLHLVIVIFSMIGFQSETDNTVCSSCSSVIEASLDWAMLSSMAARDCGICLRDGRTTAELSVTEEAVADVGSE